MACRRWGVPAGLVAGVFGAQLLFFHGIPAAWLAIPMLCLAALRRASLPAALAIGLAWSEQALDSRQADRLTEVPPDSVVEIPGWIDGLPEVFDSHTRFRFRPEPGSRGPPDMPGALLVYWYRDPPKLVPGDTWQLQVTLRPPWAEVNFQGADRERWYFAEGIGALATVRSGTRLARPPRGPPWHRWRHEVRERIGTLVTDPGRRGILLALAIADRSTLAPTDRHVLVATGTAHLLAISGLHVGLAALYGYWVGRLLLMAVPARFGGTRGYPWCLVLGGLAALVYAALAGFGTSTVRALLMLGVALLALLTRRSTHPGWAWTVALALVLWVDPLAPLRAGFWLSFTAVAVLLMLFAPRRGVRRGFWSSLLMAQSGIMLVMLPLGAWWFQAAAPAGLLANLVAIPWVSLVVVPLTLAGLALLSFGDLVAGPLLTVAGGCANGLTFVLAALELLPGARLDLPQPALWAVALATAGAALLLLPRGLPQRGLGLVLLLPLSLVLPATPTGGLRLDVLDTGQGSALLLAAQDRLLVYDSGPGDGRAFDKVASVIAPAIRQAGHTAPDRILISHGDLDHAGGLAALRARYPDTPVFARLDRVLPGVSGCHDAMQWHWNDTSFRILHPSPHLPYLGNDASCVLSVRSLRGSVLLTGDISQTVERRLVEAGLAHHTVLLVPHHGSASSSSRELIHSTKPQVAVVTAGIGNRFGFPRPEVVQRYRDAGTPLWSTHACGALRIEIDADGRLTASSARRARSAPWRWPPDAVCP